MILIDGPNFAYRAFYSGGDLSSSDGQRTGLLHVAIAMLAALDGLFEPQQVVFLWDQGPSWRKAVFPEYKATRHDTPDRKSVYEQIAIFKQLLSAIGICQVAWPRYEADDLAGVVTDSLSCHAVMISSDKDLFQLLRPGIVQVRGWKGKRKDVWTAQRVQEEYGVTVDMWPTYLALVGDSSDNIPNVQRGFGPKKALKLINSAELLPPEMNRVFLRNLELTTIRRELPNKQRLELHAPKQTKQGWVDMERLLLQYELLHVFERRRKLWVVGGWGRD